MLMHGKTAVDEIIIHCAATRPGWMAGKPLAAKVTEIRRWHVRDNGWSDIGYHWIIDRDGKVAPGRPEGTPGAHVAGHNTGSIGICLIGGHGSSAADDFHEHYTVAQEDALVQLIESIKKRAKIAKISGHNQYAAKACPGFSVPDWYPEARDHFIRAASATRNPAQPAAAFGSKSAVNKPSIFGMIRKLLGVKG
ncbi:N-acetylmuramoyl-L-alanine amidase [Paracoccus sp. MA]|uniref:N-acetylmuramoyl-L-alanine amidase n=1 Tax=Paracoccus sp. MA TaxID=2895796 RepID=UPI001E36184C|nr:N-acetylmuramoyl-L-alanine amidase [Paracoccus sp. MA]UFM66809.1 N-acetylmuramoyl-L-alanine amidase [Paracoccus sp. MA]